MPTYRPRVAAVLRVPEMGAPAERATQASDDSLVSFPIRIRRAFWESNDHQHADVLRLTAEWRDAGADPRLLSSATVQFYLGNADDRGQWSPGNDTLRFIGTLVRARRIAREGDGFSVELEFQDYTSFFLRAKLPPEGVPDYSQSLGDAWARICDNTGYLDPGGSSKIVSTVSALRDRLTPAGQLANGSLPALSTAAAPRFARLGARVPVKPGADAWAVWQQCVGMCGLISFIRKDECIVTLAQDFYSDHNPPRLVWGQNILELSESRNADLAGKGVGITSIDPLTNRTLESFYPALGASAQKRAVSSGGAQSDHYEMFPYPGITDQTTLDGLARRIWEERSRQELEGQLTTAEMLSSTVSGETFDLLTLGPGDALRVEFEEKDKEALRSIPTVQARIAYLTARGYADGVAELIAKDADAFAGAPPEFCVKRVTVDLQTDGEGGGSFDLQANYCNRLQV
jgi:hypothetical protein